MLRRLTILLVLFAGLGLTAWVSTTESASPPDAPAHDATKASPAVGTTAAAIPLPEGAPRAVADRTAVATPPQQLAGVVVDVAGTPIADVAIDLVADPWTFFRTTTDATGRFVVERRSNDPAASHVELWFEDERHDGARQWLPWGGHDLRVVLHPRVAIELEIRTHDGTVPDIDSIELRWEDLMPYRREPTASWLARDGGSWRGTSQRGTTWVGIRGQEPPASVPTPFGNRYAACLTPTFGFYVDVQGDEPVHLQLTLPSMGARILHLVDPDGAPIGNAQIEVHDRAPLAELVANRRTTGMRRGLSLMSAGWHRRPGANEDHRVLGAIDQPPWVEVQAPGYLPVRIDDLAFDTDETLVVTLAREAANPSPPRDAIATTAEPHAASGALEIDLRAVGGAPLRGLFCRLCAEPPARDFDAASDGDGVVRATVPAGTIRVCCQTQALLDAWWQGERRDEVLRGLLHELGVLRVAEGATTRAVLTVPADLPK